MADTKDFRARQKAFYDANFAAKSVDGFSIRASDIPWPGPQPQQGDTWGKWRYENDGRHWERRLIWYGQPYGYGIAARYKTAIAAFRTILHVSQKTWATPEVIGTLIQALIDINQDLEGLCYPAGRQA